MARTWLMMARSNTRRSIVLWAEHAALPYMNHLPDHIIIIQWDKCISLGYLEFSIPNYEGIILGHNGWEIRNTFVRSSWAYVMLPLQHRLVNHRLPHTVDHQLFAWILGTCCGLDCGLTTFNENIPFSLAL